MKDDDPFDEFNRQRDMLLGPAAKAAIADAERMRQQLDLYAGDLARSAALIGDATKGIAADFVRAAGLDKVPSVADTLPKVLADLAPSIEAARRLGEDVAARNAEFLRPLLDDARFPGTLPTIGDMAAQGLADMVRLAGVDKLPSPEGLLPSGFASHAATMAAFTQNVDKIAADNARALRSIVDYAGGADLDRYLHPFGSEIANLVARDQAIANSAIELQKWREQSDREMIDRARASTEIMESLNRSAQQGTERIIRQVVEEVSKSRNARITNALDLRVIDALREKSPGAADAYEQALIELEGEDKLSWRGPASDLREALRVALDCMAQDDAVMAEPWYKPEQDSGKPTRRQRMEFVLRARQKSEKTITITGGFVDVIEAWCEIAPEAYNIASKAVHTPPRRSDVEKLRDYSRLVLEELLLG